MARPHRLYPDGYVGLSQYFLTVCAYRRQSHFTDQRTVTETTRHFLQTAVREQCEISAYCFMPDHMHALVTTTAEAANFHRFVRLTKQYSGFAFKRATGLRLWQDSFFDRTLRADETVPEIIKYIVENPVRAGLVRTPADYPYWGSQIYSREALLEFIAIESRRV